MIKLNAKIFSAGFILLTLGSGLFLGFLMDYCHGWEFGSAFLVVELTDNQNYAVLACAALVASLSAFPLFRKRKPEDTPNVGLFLLHHCTTLTAVLIMGFISYCTLPSNVRNTVFGLGMTDFLIQYSTEADLLGKLLVMLEKNPGLTTDLPGSRVSFIKGGWPSRIGMRRMLYARHCKALIINGHAHGRNKCSIAAFLDSVDEAAAKEVIAEIFDERPLFSTRAYGLTLVWEDINY
ncbi:MAG: hypothetical protein JWR15_1397 [Prosthecobacter sp.]|nr:hypothetical protein [Prosthecobacter sp.]